ncbi:hypothetical protein [Fibrisoma limi]|uniref:hypothetical protein n=1 Tax=Fibrisoma limi TaxID=663275 RepID=UPI00118198E6|nr:hypothetical protein [Fibrisoma limi]
MKSFDPRSLIGVALGFAIAYLLDGYASTIPCSAFGYFLAKAWFVDDNSKRFIYLLYGVGAFIVAFIGVLLYHIHWGVPVFFALLIVSIGVATMCPKCGVWWKRRLVKEDYLGSTIHQTTSSENRPAYDNRGIEVGRVNIDVPKFSTRNNYLKNYCCTKCGHTWSKSVTR